MSQRKPRQRLWPVTVKGRDRLHAVLLLAAAGLAGYLVTWVAYPAPLIARDHPTARVLGLPFDQAAKALAEAGQRAKLDGEETDPVVPTGHVTWQDPPPGTAVPRGFVVHLTTSSGPAPVSVPDVAGLEVAQARQILEAAGLGVGELDAVPNGADAGVIVATRPPTGTTRPSGSRIGLVISKGPADIQVPDLTGLGEEEARRRLENAGLKVGKVSTRSAPGRPGLVLQQRPGPGVFSPHESRVDLVISH